MGDKDIMKNVVALKKEVTNSENLSPTLKEYKNYRLASIKLMTKLTNFVLDLGKEERVMQAGRLLNIVSKDTLWIYNESERDFFSDFLIFDYNFDSLKNNIETYISLNSAQEGIEQDLFKALLKSYTSLFRIISIDKSNCKLCLYDILNKVYEIYLVDVNMSKTSQPGMIFFTRLIPLKNFNMTSGMSFGFTSDMETYLVNKYKRLGRKVKSESESIKRFASFFQLNRSDGINSKLSNPWDKVES